MGNTLQSVDRALRILVAFETEGQEIGVGELAEFLDVHKSTASRLAATLRAHGLLERVPDSERFRLGSQLARLGMIALRGRDLVEAARRPMSGLAARTGETVTLAVRHGDELATVAQIEARYVIGIQNWLGRRTPLHCSSDGKVMLAFGEAELPRGRLRALTKATVTSRRALLGQLEDVRERGFAVAVGELEEGLNGVAVPVLDASGRCCAALSVSGPSYRVAPDFLDAFAESCKEAAAEIGAHLIWTTDGALDPGDGADGAGRAPRAEMGGGRPARSGSRGR